MPKELRFRVMQLRGDVKKWEDQVAQTLAMQAASRSSTRTAHSSTDKDGTVVAASASSDDVRYFYSRARAYPLVTASVIKYNAGEEKARHENRKAEDAKGLEVFVLTLRDWRGQSYESYVQQPTSTERRSDYFYERGYMHDPNSLDDPDKRHGAHRYMLKGSTQSGPVISSIILYAKEEELKEDLNEQFREKHPNLPPSLNLFEVRSLTKKMIVGCMSLGMELATAALAYIYFETLCLKALVTKWNRELTMAVSLLLAFKYHEPPPLHGAPGEARLLDLLTLLERDWEVSRKDLFSAEFGAFVHLRFSLHIPAPHVRLVLMRFLKLLHKTPRQYFGDFVSSIEMIESRQ